VIRPHIDGLPDALPERGQSLTAGAAAVVEWEVTVPIGVDTLTYTLEASDSGGASDRVRVTQRVRPAVPVRTFQATLFRWERPVEQPVQRPPDALPDRGAVRVGFAPRLSAGLDGVRDWMRRYPYSCRRCCRRISTVTGY
jgi:hypothetical protein